MHSNPIVVQLALRNPVPLQVQEIFGVINGFILAICGIAVLSEL
jgi:hypothetical protein